MTQCQVGLNPPPPPCTRPPAFCTVLSLNVRYRCRRVLPPSSCTVGRVLNRLSKDTASIDGEVPNLLGGVWNVSINVLANFVAVYVTLL